MSQSAVSVVAMTNAGPVRRLVSIYLIMLKWQLLRLQMLMPIIAIVQVLVGVGAVIGLGFYYKGITKEVATYLATGAPTLSLITLGLVGVPQWVSQSKLEGTFDYMWSLPVPRLVTLVADVTIWLGITLPGLVLALFVAALRYDLTFTISPLVVPAVLLVVMTATAIGYAIAYLSPSPVLTGAITNFLVFALFLFSPIGFPSSQLPGWLAGIHNFLPVKYMADSVRGSLTGAWIDGVALPFAVLSAWCAVGFAITWVVISRKR